MTARRPSVDPAILPPTGLVFKEEEVKKPEKAKVGDPRLGTAHSKTVELGKRTPSSIPITKKTYILGKEPPTPAELPTRLPKVI
jgi:hypothetical protein